MFKENKTILFHIWLYLHCHAMLQIKEALEQNIKLLKFDHLIASSSFQTGNHPEQVANQLLTEEVFFVNKETVNHAGENLARCLDTWVEEEKICDKRSSTTKVKMF